MVTDRQVRRLMKLIKRNKILAVAAAKSGIDEKTARKYRRLGKLPSEVKVAHTWRTREDPFADVWEEIRSQLSFDQRDLLLGQMTAVGVERVFKDPDEGLGILFKDCLAVGLARVRQHNPQDTGSALPTVFDNPGPGTKVDLGFMTRRAFHPPKRQRSPFAQPPDKPFDRGVRASKSMLADQVLPDPLRR